MPSHPNRSRHARKVVTWQSPRGGKLDVCTRCETILRRARTWPKDSAGQEYCTVSFGKHVGRCDLGQDPGRQAE